MNGYQDIQDEGPFEVNPYKKPSNRNYPPPQYYPPPGQYKHPPNDYEEYVYVIQISKITSQHLTNNVDIATMVYDDKKEAEKVINALRNDEKYRFMYINLKKVYINVSEASFTNVLKNTH